MTVDQILSRFDDTIVTLATTLREALLKKFKDIQELPDESAALIGYGYGTGYKDTVFVIMLSKKGVKLGFPKGSELPDPQKLLTGTGKVHRYIEIKNEADIRSAALQTLLAEAMKAYQARKK